MAQAIILKLGHISLYIVRVHKADSDEFAIGAKGVVRNSRRKGFPVVLEGLSNAIFSDKDRDTFDENRHLYFPSTVLLSRFRHRY
jgi:hypothetical protein